MYTGLHKYRHHIPWFNLYSPISARLGWEASSYRHSYLSITTVTYQVCELLDGGKMLCATET